MGIGDLVNVGVHKIGDEEDSLIYTVDRVINHPGYNRRTLENDIALIRVKIPMAFWMYVGPICPPEPDNLYVDMQALVSGWGHTSHGKSLRSI